MSFRDKIIAGIQQYGHMVIGVDDNPSFAYTVGLTSRFGCELLVIGLPYQYAHAILNDIASKFSPDLLDKPTTEFSNLPLLLKETDMSLGVLHDEYVCQADNFYGKEVNVVQVILSDRQGRTPLNDDYDHEYMDPRQRLFVDFTKR